MRIVCLGILLTDTKTKGIKGGMEEKRVYVVGNETQPILSQLLSPKVFFLLK